jgi:hypothetical protein
MVISKIVENKEESNSFPKLMMSVDCGSIVLFTSESIGTVLSGSNKYKLGDFSRDWFPNCFEDFTGELILKSNK